MSPLMRPLSPPTGFSFTSTEPMPPASVKPMLSPSPEAIDTVDADCGAAMAALS